MIIGSNSFSGSHLAAHLLSNHYEVHGVSRSKEPNAVFLPYRWGMDERNFQFYQYDLNTDFDRFLELVLKIRPEYIVNFAAQGMVAPSWENPEQWMMTNAVVCAWLVKGLKNRAFLKKYVQISTPEVYGSCEGLVKEDTGYDPSTPYAVSKTAADMMLTAYFKTYGFPVVFIRSANVFGPGQQLYRIVPRAAWYFLKERTLLLHGGGRSVRSFIHIQDVCRGIEKAMISGQPGEAFHFATEKNISIRSLVKLIATRLCVPFSEFVDDVDDRPGKDRAYLLDCSKSNRVLDWRAEIGLEDGIDQTIAWIKKNMDVLQTEPEEYIHKP